MNAKLLNSANVVAGAVLRQETREALEAFYLPHTQRLLDDVLPALRERGIAVYGFDDAPWTSKL